MVHPMGESKNGLLRVDFDRRVKLEFHGSKVTSDGGLLAYRELDDALGLTEMAAGALRDGRRGKNGWHAVVGMLRQAVFGRLAGYEDVNDAERLSRDPAMRWIVGGKATDRGAASSSQMGRFETQWLTGDVNLTALSALSGLWIDRVHRRKPPKLIILDMDSSVSPTHGEQEGTAYNGHFGCTCYHPLFVFNQLVDLERCALRPGNVHSADGWRAVLDPVVARYRERKLRRYFRGDAAFASPDIYEYLEAEGFGYAIRLPANSVAPGIRRPPATAPEGTAPDGSPSLLRQLQLSGWKLDPGAARGGESGMASGRVVSPRRVRRHQSVPARRADRRLLQPAWHGGTTHQGGQERDPLDATILPTLQGQRGSASASCTGLQPGQLHAHASFARPSEQLVADDAAREAGENWGKSRASRTLRHLPIGRGRAPARPVRRYPGSDRPLATTADTSVSQRYANQNDFTTGDLCPERYEIGTGPWVSDQRPVVLAVLGRFPIPDASQIASQQRPRQYERRDRALRGRSRMNVVIGRYVGDPG